MASFGQISSHDLQAVHFEEADERGRVAGADLAAARSALERHAGALSLQVGRWRAPPVQRAGR